MDDLLRVDIMVRLKVDTLIGHVEQTFNLHERQDPFNFKLAGKQWFFWEVLDLSQIEADLGHLSPIFLSWIEHMCHIWDHLLNFHLITKRILWLKHCDKRLQSLVENGQLIKLDV